MGEEGGVIYQFKCCWVVKESEEDSSTRVKGNQEIIQYRDIALSVECFMQ